MTQPVTPDELAATMTRAGKTISAGAVRYHCRQGLLRESAIQVHRTWLIPPDAAARFADDWSPYVTLKRRP